MTHRYGKGFVVVDKMSGLPAWDFWVHTTEQAAEDFIFRASAGYDRRNLRNKLLIRPATAEEMADFDAQQKADANRYGD